MSVRHRVVKAVVKLAKEPDDSWAYETYTVGNQAFFVFESDRSAQLVAEALHAMFKRKPLIHNGRKARK